MVKLIQSKEGRILDLELLELVLDSHTAAQHMQVKSGLHELVCLSGERLTCLGAAC